MQSPLEKYIAEMKEYEARFNCLHENLELKRRKVKGDAIQYVKQCLTCGNAMPQPIKTETALKINGGNEPFLFDEQKQVDWKAQKVNAYKEIRVRYEESKNVAIAEHSEWYRDYLKSPEWKLKRKKVLKRANNICEGCLEQPAIEVHHVSYANIGDELLYQLAALCEDCHRKAHINDIQDDIDSSSVQ